MEQKCQYIQMEQKGEKDFKFPFLPLSLQHKIFNLSTYQRHRRIQMLLGAFIGIVYPM